MRGSRASPRDTLNAIRPSLSVQARAVANTMISGGTYAAGHQKSPCVAIQSHDPAALQPANVLMQTIGTAANNPSKASRRPFNASATS